MIKTRYIYELNALFILVLMGVLLSGYYQQYFKHEMPCPLCLIQRLGMLGTALGLLMNLRFGLHINHYGFSFLSAFFGGAVALRQVALHVCPGFPVFGIPVWGINLYTWSFITFCCATFALIVFLFLHPENEEHKRPLPLTWLGYLAFGAIVVLVLSNFITTFEECGFGLCKDVPWPQPE